MARWATAPSSSHVVALGALLLPARALRVPAGDKVSPVLQRQFADLFLLESVRSDAGASAGAARSRDEFAAATRALVMLGVFLAIAAALLLGALLMLLRSHPATVSKPPPQARGRAGPDRPRGTASSLEQEFEHHAAGLTSSAGPSSAGHECQSDATITDREDGSPSQRPLVPLCPQLMVPTSSNLRVVVPELACHRRQDTFINICSVPSLGGSPLFRARVSEREPAASGARGVYLETLEGDQQFAWVSTEELWSSSPGGPAPKLTIMRPDGLQFATMKKNNRGDYVIMCGLGILAVFSGDFRAHEAHVVSSQGRLMAQVQHSGQGSYEVTTSPDIDAGLILLGLLAIDKCERAA